MAERHGIDPGPGPMRDAPAGRSSASGPAPAPGLDWVGIAANAASGRGAGRSAVERLARELRRLGIEPRVAWTPAERSALAADAASGPRSGCRCLVAAGGDGTVSALINERPAVPIAVLPVGTENLFARHFGFVRDPARAAARIASGGSSSLDLGRVGGRRFALMAGIGFDADVVSRHHRARVGRSGSMRPTHRAAYVEPVLRSSFRYRFPTLHLAFEGAGGRPETLQGSTAFVFNLPRYALGLPFAPTARGDDGWLDLVVFRDPGPFRALHYLWLVVSGQHLGRPGISHRRVRRVAIEAAEPVPVQLDGDPGGTILPGASPPWMAEVEADALGVVAPAVPAVIAS